jgi:secreted trypsin-like serine protease
MFSLMMSLAFAQEPAPPIVNGSTTSAFIQVGVIMAYYEGQGGAPFCSGTLIHEKWVATAGHCIEAVEDYANAGYDIYFAVGTSLSEDDIEDYDLAVNWVEHPDYSSSQSGISADIGLLELETGFPDIDPMALNDIPPDETWYGELLDYVGWGVTSDNSQDSGVKRTAQIPYQESDETFIYSYDSQTNLCSGDSGGAALLDTEDGYVLVGVNSFVFPVQDSSPCVGGASGATRIDVYLDWIDTYLPEPEPIIEETEEECEQDEDGDCIEESKGLFGCSSVNVDTPLWLSLLGLAFFVRRRTD